MRREKCKSCVFPFIQPNTSLSPIQKRMLLKYDKPNISIKVNASGSADLNKSLIRIANRNLIRSTEFNKNHSQILYDCQMRLPHSENKIGAHHNSINCSFNKLHESLSPLPENASVSPIKHFHEQTQLSTLNKETEIEEWPKLNKSSIFYNKSSVKYNIINHDINSFSGTPDVGILKKGIMNKAKGITEIIDLKGNARIHHNVVILNVHNKSPNAFKKRFGMFSNFYDRAFRTKILNSPFK